MPGKKLAVAVIATLAVAVWVAAAAYLLGTAIL